MGHSTASGRTQNMEKQAEKLARDLASAGNSSTFSELKRLVSQAKKDAINGNSEGLLWDAFWIVDKDGSEHFIYEQDNDIADLRDMKIKNIAYIRYQNGDGWYDSLGASESHHVFRNDQDSSVQQAYENEIARIYKTRWGRRH